MDITAVSAVSQFAAVDSARAGSSASPLTADQLSRESDSQLMVLAARGNARAIRELDKRDAVRAARLPPTADQTVTPVNAGSPAVVELENRDASAQATRLQASAELATTLNARTLLDLEQRNAAHAAKLLADADQNVSAFPPRRVGNVVNTFF